MSDNPGVLAIWNNCAPGREADFEEWYQHEHFFERIAVPGFRIGRRYEALSGTPAYFCFYLTDSPSVLKSPAYLERLNNPTPLTRSVMSGPFRDAIRTVCSRSLRAGAMRGSVAVTLRFTAAPDQAALAQAATSLAADKAVACGEVWTAMSAADFPVSEEEKVRGGDRRITACLFVETLRAADAEALAGRLGRQFSTAEIGVYRLLCEIRPS